ncbi:MAG: replication initiation factor domain-containing protein [Burkholderiales bacterium]|nr:replication initiation factor domain-containing protein [Burkholderiales bacterium]
MKPGRTVAAQAVSDGRRIKWTLEQAIQGETDRVRVDWLRFTLPLGAVVPFEQRGEVDPGVLGTMDRAEREVQVLARGIEAEPLGAMYVARKAAVMLADRLGFEVGTVEDRGQDFYLCRVPLLVNAETVGFVLAGSDKSAQQAGTVHFNLFGAACLRVSHAQWAGVASWVRDASGWITRCDLALDIFEGFDIASMPQAWLNGQFDVRGQRPAEREAGAWTSGHSRTFYVGKRETGKELRGYEKGDELFGHEAGDPWFRAEVEFRNNARVIDPAILERPADFFAGAYPWCAALLAAQSVQAEPVRIPAGQRVKDATARAAVSRTAAWVVRVAMPSVREVFDKAGEFFDEQLIGSVGRLSHRLRGWSEVERRQAFAQVFGASPLASGP